MLKALPLSAAAVGADDEESLLAGLGLEGMIDGGA